MPVALVTGSSRGIGRSIALRFAEDGYDVAVNYVRSADKAEAVARKITETGQDAIAVQADVGEPGDARELVETTVEELGGLDHVVNNAGINQKGVTTETITPEEFDRIMDVNVNSAFVISKEARPHLRDSEEAAGPSIANITSFLAYTGSPSPTYPSSPTNVHYSSSKGALISLTRSHAREFAPEIRVNSVAPGHIKTDMTDYPEEKERERLGAIPLGIAGYPEDVADAVAYLRDSRFVTGETMNVTGGEIIL